jgi:hypothetical protein
MYIRLGERSSSFPLPVSLTHSLSLSLSLSLTLSLSLSLSLSLQRSLLFYKPAKVSRRRCETKILGKARGDARVPIKIP